MGKDLQASEPPGRGLFAPLSSHQIPELLGQTLGRRRIDHHPGSELEASGHRCEAGYDLDVPEKEGLLRPLNRRTVNYVVEGRVLKRRAEQTQRAAESAACRGQLAVGGVSKGKTVCAGKDPGLVGPARREWKKRDEAIALKEHTFAGSALGFAELTIEAGAMLLEVDARNLVAPSQERRLHRRPDDLGMRMDERGASDRPMILEDEDNPDARVPAHRAVASLVEPQDDGERSSDMSAS